MISKARSSPLEKAKQKRLQEKGWAVGEAQDFLGLSDAEAAFVEMKLALSQALLKRRRLLKRSQVEVAQLLSSSQSRVAKMEAGDPSVSVDLLLKALLKMGATAEEVGKAIGRSPQKSSRFTRRKEKMPVLRASHLGQH
jgi:hypothetical protein